jgi:hypothetical protein
MWERNQFMPVADASRMLRRSPQTVINMLKDGRLRGIDRGSGLRPRWLVARESVSETLYSSERREPLQDAAPQNQELSALRERSIWLQAELARSRRVNLELVEAVSALSRALRENLGQAGDSP